MELRTDDGSAVGTVDILRQGEDTVFDLTARLPAGLWRITACGTAGELTLGVTEGGAVHLRRLFSAALAGRLGTVRSVTAQRAGARMESEWQVCRDVPCGLPPLPAGALHRRESWGRTLALPWREETPFPWTPLFCLARVGRMAGRTWVFYSLGGDGDPVFSPNSAEKFPKPPTISCGGVV